MDPASNSIINKIMDMDLNDNIAVKNVIDIITGHSFRNAFVLSNLLATSTHQNTALSKALFFHHDAYTPDELSSYVFGKKDGPHFLVNLIEQRLGITPYDTPFETYGIICDMEDIPIPPVQYKGIEELVRIDIHKDGRFTIRNITASKLPTANGRLYSVGNICFVDMIRALHMRENGYKSVERLTTFLDEEGDNLSLLDTFENKLLNHIHGVQINIRNVGDLITFAEGLLLGHCHHPYDGQRILSVQSPIDGMTFMISFDRSNVGALHQRKRALTLNMHNLLAHYIPDYVFNSNQRRVILLAITYNIDTEPHFELIDTIVSFAFSTQTKYFKDVLDNYVNNISLMDRCRYVILKNKHLMEDRVKDLPPFIRSFIWSTRRSKELIDFRPIF